MERQAAAARWQQLVAEDPRLEPTAQLHLELLARLPQGDPAIEWPLNVEEAVARLEAGAPALRGAEEQVDLGPAAEAFRRLAGMDNRHGVKPLLDALLRGDAAQVAERSERVGQTPAAAATLGQIALSATLRHLASALPPEATAHWQDGHCPFCGAWPALAELHGTEQRRRLRCGWCGSGWTPPRLQCPYCGNHESKSLRYLQPDGPEERRRIDACDRCRGYVKVLAVLEPIPPGQVLVEDLATLVLDVAAEERGYLRPGRPDKTDPAA
jgi:FdhE protein